MSATTQTDEVPKLALRPEQTAVGGGEFYRFLYTYWIYQDRLGWGRIQWILIIEGATLAAALSRADPLGSVIMSLGTVLLLCVYAVIQRDWQVRECLATWLDKVHEPYGFRLIPPPARGAPRAGKLLATVFWALIVINILVAVVLAHPDLRWLLA